MIRCSASSICIFALIFNFAFLIAQEEDIDVKTSVDIEMTEEISPPMDEHNGHDSLNTAVVEEESLSVEIQNVAETDSVPVIENDEFPKKKFRGTAKDVVLAATSIVGWLFFMWLTANQRE